MRNMKFGFLLVFAILALVATASAALPTSLVATLSHPGSNSYWGVNVNSITPVADSDILTTEYVGWCADSQTGLTTGSHTFNVYSSLGALPSGMPSVNWYAVNWIINNKGNADMYTVQAALWHYDGGPHPWGTINTADYDALIAGGDAAAAAHFVPGENQVYAVILWQSGTQPVFIEVPIKTIPSPEFPSLAAPIGMLIGVVGAAQYIKTRKE
jgi:hypothetical protein